MPKRLTDDQKKAIQTIINTQGRAASFLLDGVTGSGKTEVYLAVIKKFLEEEDRGGYIVLVPEISLTPQTVQRFASRFPGDVVLWHSQLSDGERFAAWCAVITGTARIVIGSRSAIFAPFSRLRLLVIDEEHDPSYKQDATPRYDSRTVAFFLSKVHACPVILGSATPRLEVVESIHRLKLPQRIHQAPLPAVTVVDMREELRAGNRSPISNLLQDALQSTLTAGEQSILFLNRRGSATAMLCRACGFVEKCASCDVAMTLHAGARLWCHHCGAQRHTPDACPSCGSNAFRPFGAGTQRIEYLVQQQFPRANVTRMDHDTTTRKGSHEKIYRGMQTGTIDILVGTQMITKGWDIPTVTLVGILAADLSLTIPDFSAAERTVQLLTQVAGRSGRGKRPGMVILQTYNPEHPVIRAVQTHNVDAFLERERAFRKRFAYPPFITMGKVSFSHAREGHAKHEVTRLASLLKDKIGDQEVNILGPTPTLVPKRRGRYTQMLLIKAKKRSALDALLKHIPAAFTIDVDPISLI